MKKTIKLFGIIALVAVIGFSMAACSDDDGGGGLIDPASKKITWTQSGKNYALALTELSASKLTYILSVGTDGYNVGTATVNSNTYSFIPDQNVLGSNPGSFTINIDSSTQKVTASSQSIKLTNNAGTTTTFTLPATDATATITDTTGGGSDINPFVGFWKDDPVQVSVSKNLTWLAAAPGYSGSGSYAYIDNTAIIYESDGSFFGYARIVGSVMQADTFEGYYVFTK